MQADYTTSTRWVPGGRLRSSLLVRLPPDSKASTPSAPWNPNPSNYHRSPAQTYRLYCEIIPTRFSVFIVTHNILRPPRGMFASFQQNQAFHLLRRPKRTTLWTAASFLQAVAPLAAVALQIFMPRLAADSKITAQVCQREASGLGQSDKAFFLGHRFGVSFHGMIAIIRCYRCPCGSCYRCPWVIPVSPSFRETYR